MRSFAVLFGAEMQSIVGDQVARVALSVLAFDRTHSAVAAAGTYAATMVPALVGGLWLSGLADRLPKRAVMVAVAALSATCFALMSIPMVPLPVLICLVVVAVAANPVFSAAEISRLSLDLGPDEYRVATAARMTGSQSAQVLGFLLGGVLVAVAGARLSLVFDAATFAVAALLIGTLLPAADKRVAATEPREVTGREEATGPTARVDLSAQEPLFAGLLRTPPLPTLLFLAGIIGFFVVPEGLAVPYGRSLGASTGQIGTLLGAAALGAAVGSVLVVRLVAPEHRMRAAQVMAAACGAPLIVSGLIDHWPVAAVCWLIAGVLSAYMVEVTSAFIQRVPITRRAHYVGLANTVVLVSQGVCMVAFGALSEPIGPGSAITVAAAVGSALAVVISAFDRRVGRRTRPRALPATGTLARGSATGAREDEFLPVAKSG